MITQLVAVLSNFAPVIGVVVQTLRIAGAVKRSLKAEFIQLRNSNVQVAVQPVVVSKNDSGFGVVGLGELGIGNFCN
jgi:hypothetical protein